MTLTKANEIINIIRERLGLVEEFFTIEHVWNKEVGIDDIEIIGYKNGTVFTKTQSSVAVSELNFRKKEIIKKLNQYIGSTKIKNIKIKIEV
ncbi:MAG: DUF721 domain-containing protein [Endomicrobium sp.]|jgi:chaperonin cofactor prefoldin|nr:DUF721 domain-containing protein [Endomicrobium sp.]